MTVDLNSPMAGITLECIDCHKQMGSLIFPNAPISRVQELIEGFRKVSTFSICITCAENRHTKTLA